MLPQKLEMTFPYITDTTQILQNEAAISRDFITKWLSVTHESRFAFYLAAAPFPPSSSLNSFTFILPLFLPLSLLSSLSPFPRSCSLFTTPHVFLRGSSTSCLSALLPTAQLPSHQPSPPPPSTHPSCPPTVPNKVYPGVCGHIKCLCITQIRAHPGVCGSTAYRSACRPV